MNAFSRSHPLIWATLIAGVMVSIAKAIAIPDSGIFEVDLVFPHNATYAPSAFMPIVFALQNPVVGWYIQTKIVWYLSPGINLNITTYNISALVDISEESVTAGQPLLVIPSFVDTTSYPEGLWTVVWNLEYNNCSLPHPAITENTFTVFTISKTGQTPDIVATTSTDTCGITDGQALNMTLAEDYCAALGPSPTINPCAATIDSAAISSISAQITATACGPIKHQQDPKVICPTSTAASTSTGNSCIATPSALLMMLAVFAALIHLG